MAQTGEVKFDLGSGMQVHAGEILGIGGLIGAGRTELLRRAFGLDPDGTIATNPALRWAEAVGYLSENRKEEGLMLPLTISENIVLPKYRQMARWGILSPGKTADAAQVWIKDLGIKARDSDQAVGELSGGNQQKVAIARLLEYPADVFLFSQDYADRLPLHNRSPPYH